MKSWQRAAIAAACIGVIAAGVIFLAGRFASPGELPRRKIPVVASATRYFGDTLQIDLGKTWFAEATVDGSGLPPATPLTIRMGERLLESGRLSSDAYGSVRFHEVTIESSTEPQQVPLPEADARGMPDGVSVMPFRYIEITPWQAGTAPASVSVTAYISDHYADIGSIRFSGDPDVAEPLNHLFELGRHSMAATSFMGIFIDGDRERLAYQADALINQRGWVALTGDTDVARDTLAELFREPTWPTEWMSQTVLLAWEMYEADGDLDYLRSIYDRLPVFALREFVDDTGLISTLDEAKAERFVSATGADYLEDIVDWPAVERDGYDMVAHNTVVNAFAFAAMQRMQNMATALGKTAEADQWQASAEALRQAMQSQLIDPDLGTYTDGLESTHVSAHALFVPLALGLVPDENQETTLEALQARIAAFNGGFPPSVYGAQFMLDAMFDAGASKAALDLMLNQTDRGWLHMLNDYDATITHEAWDIRYKENMDWNHAWGSAFFNVMFRKILGAEVLVPGWAQWTINPAPDLDLDINATLATPQGPVDVVVAFKDRLVTVTGGTPLLGFTPGADNGWTYRLITGP